MPRRRAKGWDGMGWDEAGWDGMGAQGWDEFNSVWIDQNLTLLGKSSHTKPLGWVCQAKIQQGVAGAIPNPAPAVQGWELGFGDDLRSGLGSDSDISRGQLSRQGLGVGGSSQLSIHHSWSQPLELILRGPSRNRHPSDGAQGSPLERRNQLLTAQIPQHPL